MSVVTRETLSFAVRSVARLGDTDIFPFPVENHWLHDDQAGVISLLENIDTDFDKVLGEHPVTFVKSLAGVGYTGFRTATQIDPIWNAYLLALVLQLAPEIEKARIPPGNAVVFSYRFQSDETNLTVFDPSLGWAAFQQKALEYSASTQLVLSTDITDFYPRVYHHRLENALQEATSNKEAVRRIKLLLFRLASDTSYGLPVGGNAARLLAELLLNRADRLLLAQGVRFVRFVDDYYIFANSRAESQRALVFLSEALLVEGLALSRSKTRLMTRAEFQRSSPVAEPAVADSTHESEARQFLKLRLRYDPYSATADQDYDVLSKELERFDIIGMLVQEFKKSRADEILVRQLVKSVRFLGPAVRAQAIESVLGNLAILYPIFPTVVILLKHVLPDLHVEQQSTVFAILRGLLQSDSHITLVPTNLAFTVRLLGHDPNIESDNVLIERYARGGIDMMIKRDIILALARRKASYWLSPTLKKFSELTPWEQRAALVGSYVLGDEGDHWRKSVKRQLSEVDRVFLAWLGTKNSGRLWEIPT